MEHKIKTPIDVECFIRNCVKGADPELAHENEDELYQKVLDSKRSNRFFCCK